MKPKVLYRKDGCEFCLQENGLYTAQDEHGIEILDPKDGTRERMVECPRCHGHGWIHVYSLLAENPCPVCNEKGQVTQRQYDRYINEKDKD